MLGQRHSDGPAWALSAGVLEEAGESSTPDGVQQFLAGIAARADSVDMLERATAKNAIAVVKYRRDSGSCGSLRVIAAKGRTQDFRVSAALALRALGDCESSMPVFRRELEEAREQLSKPLGPSSRSAAERRLRLAAEELVFCGDLGEPLELLLGQYLGDENSASKSAANSLGEVVAYRLLYQNQIERLAGIVEIQLAERGAQHDVRLAGVVADHGDLGLDRFRPVLQAIAKRTDSMARLSVQSVLAAERAGVRVPPLTQPDAVCIGGAL